jgi:hypothetical protein
LIPALPFLFLGLGHRPLPVAAAPAGGNEASGHFSVTDAKVHVYDLAGHVDVVAGSGGAVKVDATFGGKDGSRLGIANLTKDGQALVVNFPSDHLRWGGDGERGSTTLQVNDDGTFDEHMNALHGGRRVRIDNRPGGLDAWADLRISVPKGQQVLVHVGVGHVTVSNVDGDLVVTGATANIDVNGARGALKVATGSGDIAASNVRGMQSFDTGSGSIHGQDLEGSDVKFDTGSGDVTAASVNAPNLKAQTGSGQIQLDGVRASTIVLGTGSGDVSVQLLSTVDRLKIGTGSGAVKIRAPANLGASLRVGTGSGGIQSDFALSDVRRGDGSLAGVIGDGKGAISVSTGSGSVSLERN